MRKQIIGLMLSAVICKANPLFAMEADDIESCSGNLRVLNNDNLHSIIEYCSLSDAVSLMCTSKRMLELEESPKIWQIFLPKYITPQTDIRNQVHDYYMLFSDLNQNYHISMAALQSFRQDPIPGSNPTAYTFSKGGIPFCLTYLSAKDTGFGDAHEKYLSVDFSRLDKDAHVIFSRKPDTMYFQAEFTLFLFSESGVVVDLHGVKFHSPEFRKRVEERATEFPKGPNGGDYIAAICSFTVEKNNKLYEEEKAQNSFKTSNF